MIENLKNLFDPLFGLLAATLSTFHGWGAPWWLSIMMLTLVVRTLLFPLTVRQVKSMRKMQELKPDMDEIRARYKDEPRKQQEEITKLYGERGINPLGGCLPLVVQLPIFIALYYTIKKFEALGSFTSGGLFWFKDLTVADPYFILPVAYVLTMMASQELTIRRTAPQQKQLMRIMPIAFGFFLARFPAALFVYYISSNLITFCQNYIIYRGSPIPALRNEPDQTPRPSAETDATSGARNGAKQASRPDSARREPTKGADRSKKTKRRRKNKAKKGRR